MRYGAVRCAVNLRLGLDLLQCRRITSESYTSALPYVSSEMFTVMCCTDDGLACVTTVVEGNRWVVVPLAG